MPKNMKYDATTKKAGAPKKKMKTNQDGGGVAAKDPAAAGKQLAADQTKAAGPGRMGYSQKFGPGRKNCYQKGAAKVADIMKNGPAQMKDVKSGERMVLTTGITKENPQGYKIDVNKDSGYAKLAQELGGNTLPNNFRSVTFTKETDPSAVNISEAEKVKRKKATYPKN